MRTQHIALNTHLHRIGVHTTSACPLCGHPEETIDHHLLYCAPLADLRTKFLPTQLNKENLLYGHQKQLQKPCKYHPIVQTALLEKMKNPFCLLVKMFDVIG